MNPELALKELKREVSNRYEETCACGGVNSNDAVVGILLTLAKICGDNNTRQVLEQTANVIEERK